MSHGAVRGRNTIPLPERPAASAAGSCRFSLLFRLILLDTTLLVAVFVVAMESCDGERRAAPEVERCDVLLEKGVAVASTARSPAGAGFDAFFVPVVGLTSRTCFAAAARKFVGREKPRSSFRPSGTALLSLALSAPATPALLFSVGSTLRRLRRFSSRLSPSTAGLLGIFGPGPSDEFSTCITGELAVAFLCTKLLSTPPFAVNFTRW
mmetsp:Transcript_27782/g.70162  ORF Transcript_27782/g.70162 Transcript_27782/m.70162 type:complete len:209 (-) Transcript_27782:306-932(-)